MRRWAQTLFAAVVAITATATSISQSAAYFEAQADSPQDAEDLRVQAMLMKCWWAPTLRGVTVNVNVFFDSNGHWSKWKFLGNYNWDARTAMTNALHGCGTDPTLSDKHFHVLLRAPTEAEVNASKIPSQPATQAAQAAVPADAQQTYTDPALYCRTFGNVDKPGKRYVGPALTDAIAGTFGKRAADNPTVQWRCMNGVVVACLSQSGGKSCAKTSVEAEPKDARGFVLGAWAAVKQDGVIAQAGSDLKQITALLDAEKNKQTKGGGAPPVQVTQPKSYDVGQVLKVFSSGIDYTNGQIEGLLVQKWSIVCIYGSVTVVLQNERDADRFADPSLKDRTMAIFEEVLRAYCQPRGGWRQYAQSFEVVSGFKAFGNSKHWMFEEVAQDRIAKAMQVAAVATSKEIALKNAMSKFGAQQFFAPSQFSANPFLSVNKVILVPMAFTRMIGQEEAVFQAGAYGQFTFMMENVPSGRFTSPGNYFVVAFTALGTKSAQALGSTTVVPYGSFVGAEFCHRAFCDDYYD